MCSSDLVCVCVGVHTPRLRVRIIVYISSTTPVNASHIGPRGSRGSLPRLPLRWSVWLFAPSSALSLPPHSLREPLPTSPPPPRPPHGPGWPLLLLRFLLLWKGSNSGRMRRVSRAREGQVRTGPTDGERKSGLVQATTPEMKAVVVL